MEHYDFLVGIYISQQKEDEYRWKGQEKREAKDHAKKSKAVQKLGRLEGVERERLNATSEKEWKEYQKR